MSARVGAVHPLPTSPSPFRPSHIIVRARVESFSGRDHRNFGQQRLGDISMYHGLTERSGREAGLPLLAFFFLLARFPFDDCLNRLLLLLLVLLPQPVSKRRLARFRFQREPSATNSGWTGVEGSTGKRTWKISSRPALLYTPYSTETRYLRKTGAKRPALCQPRAD